MKKFIVLSILILTSCSQNQPSEAPNSTIVPISTTPNVSTMPDNERINSLKLNNGATLILAKGWSEIPEEHNMEGASLTYLYNDNQQRGSIAEYDLNSWSPSKIDGINIATVEEENNFKKLFLNLANAKTLTLELHGQIKENDFGSLLSENDFIFNTSPLILSQDGVFGFTYLTVANTRPLSLKPQYVGWLYNHKEMRLIKLVWTLNEKEPLLIQRNSELTKASPDDQSAKYSEAIAWLKEYVENTPRSRLAWGEEFQTVDDTLMTYHL